MIGKRTSAVDPAFPHTAILIRRLERVERFLIALANDQTHEICLLKNTARDHASIVAFAGKVLTDLVTPTSEEPQ